MRNSNRRNAKALAILSAAAGFTVATHSASAQTWVNPNTGVWSNAVNWIGGVPVSAVTTQLGFNATGAQTYTATNDLGAFTLNRLTFGNAGTGVINLAGGSLTFGGATPQIVQNGSGAASVANAINISTTGVNTDVLAINGTGAGALNLTGAINSSPAATGTGGGALRQNDANNTTSLSGGGSLYSLRSNAGTLAITGGTWTVTSTQRRNDVVGALDDGEWSLSIGETVGQVARFQMTGGTLTGQMAFLAVPNGGVGIATFSNGAIANFNNANGRFGINSGNGTINVLSGAQISMRLAEFGRQTHTDDTSYTAVVNVDGANSLINVAQQLVLPRGLANGTMTLSNGGGVTVTGNAFNGTGVNAAGDPVPNNVTVTVGSGSSYLVNDTSPQVGGQQAWGTGGNATLVLNTGGTVTGRNTFAGNGGVDAGGIATLLIQGGNYINRGQLAIESAAGPSLLRISNGGTMNMNQAGGGTFLSAFTSTNGNDKAMIEVTGAGSQFLQTGTSALIASGGGGAGVAGGISTISINAGGLMRIGNGAFALAENPASLGVATITGAGSRMVVGDSSIGSGDFIVSDDTTAVGNFSVLAGGTLGVGRSMFIATTETGTGSMTVDGAGSRADVARALVMSGGAQTGAGDPINGGTSNLNVTNGGVLTAQNAFLGSNVNSRSTTNITGTNSLVTVDAAGAGTSLLVLADDTGSVGTLNITAGGRLNVVGNSFTSAAPGTGAGSLTAPISVVNVNAGTWTTSGQLQIGGSGGTLGGLSTVNVTNGGFLSASGTPTSLLAVYQTSTLNIGAGAAQGTVVAGTLGAAIDGRVNFNSGTFMTNGTFSVAGSVILANRATGNKKVLETGTLEFDGTGVVDLNDNDSLHHTTPYITVFNAIKAGRMNGTWNGPGLTSTAAKNNALQNTTLGSATGTEYGLTRLFNGRSVVATDVVVKYTYNGDADLNGRVNFDDYTRIDNGFNNLLTGWVNGDFDYNGKVNFDDYTLIDGAFNSQGAPIARPTGAPIPAGPGNVVVVNSSIRDATEVGSVDAAEIAMRLKDIVAARMEQMDGAGASTLSRAVPEPATLGLVGLSLVGALSRRRRSR